MCTIPSSNTTKGLKGHSGSGAARPASLMTIWEMSHTPEMECAPTKTREGQTQILSEAMELSTGYSTDE